MAVKYLRFILILLVVSLAVWQLSPHLRDFEQIYRLRSKINYFWLFLAILSQTGQYIGDGWLSLILLKVTKTRVSFINTIRIASMNVFAANLLPVGQAGALATAYYFYKKLGVTNQNFIFLSLCWTAITTSSLLLIFTFSLITLKELPSLGFSYKIAALIILFVILLIASLSLISKQIVWPKVRHLIAKTAIFQEFALFKKNSPNFKQSIINNKFSFYKAFIAAFIFYLSSIFTLMFSFLTFGIKVPFDVAAIAYTLSFAAGWITLAPAGIGATEATMILIFLQFNFPPAEAVAGTLLFRLISFWIPIATGLISYISLKRTTAQKSSHKS